MTLVCDATALVSLGAIDSISLLRHVDSDVVISPWVRDRELRGYTDQVSFGIAEGWLRIQEPSTTEVRQLIAVSQSTYELDRGEAETLIVARHQPGRNTSVLIDEGKAFRFVLRFLAGRGETSHWTLVCLAEILHDLEAFGVIESPAATMHRLLDADLYRWANSVWTYYLVQCDVRGLAPVPRTKRGQHLRN